jgi:lysophospholipase L1-like esterase
MGFTPKVTVIVAGANDVGYPQANVVARNVQRIETALRAMGKTQVVWLTIIHPVYGAAWNAALVDVDKRWANFHLCDWAAQVKAHPQYLERDGVHMTVGPKGGYVAMANFVTACARAAGGG